MTRKFNAIVLSLSLGLASGSLLAAPGCDLGALVEDSLKGAVGDVVDGYVDEYDDCYEEYGYDCYEEELS